jgi:hypothetical protein
MVIVVRATMLCQLSARGYVFSTVALNPRRIGERNAATLTFSQLSSRRSSIQVAGHNATIRASAVTHLAQITYQIDNCSMTELAQSGAVNSALVGSLVGVALGA